MEMIFMKLWSAQQNIMIFLGKSIMIFGGHLIGFQHFSSEVCKLKTTKQLVLTWQYSISSLLFIYDRFHFLLAWFIGFVGLP